MERMGPLDASFLSVEDGITHMHIGTCAVFEGPPPRYQQVVGAIRAKLDLVPRYRQVVRFVPLGLGRPVWVDDAHFNLEYHVRHSALPPPGGSAELEALMGRLMSQELDRHRPLWEAWVVEGLEEDRWALIGKIHHCLADGVSGTDLLGVVLDRDRDVAPAPVADWSPELQPSSLRLAGAALGELALTPYEQLRAARRALCSPVEAAAGVRDIVGGVMSYARGLVPTEVNSLVGSIGPQRRWTWASTELEDLKKIRRSYDVTVNDVILAAVASGWRRLLVNRGEPAERIRVRSLVPVSVRREAERGTYNNRVSAVFAELPVVLDDPIDRLLAVAKHMETLKRSHEIQAGESLVALGETAPFAFMAGAERAIMRAVRRVPQHSINTVTTNVPGPQFPLYLAGRQMLEHLPFVPIAHGVRMGVAIASYNGKVAFGITGDYETAPDIDVLASGIEDAVAEMLTSRRRRSSRSGVPQTRGRVPPPSGGRIGEEEAATATPAKPTKSTTSTKPTRTTAKTRTTRTTRTMTAQTKATKG